MKLARIVSGGQTGADRAALDAARKRRLPYGGWCPRGGWAEDLPEPPGLLALYPELSETHAVDGSVRTRWNVRDSDATLVLFLSHLEPSPGTTLTIGTAVELGRPHLVARADDLEAVTGWLRELGDELVLNVAGPRESEDPGLYAAAHQTLDKLIGNR